VATVTTTLSSSPSTTWREASARKHHAPWYEEEFGSRPEVAVADLGIRASSAAFTLETCSPETSESPDGEVTDSHQRGGDRLAEPGGGLHLPNPLSSFLIRG
jgi:hypothetical protein